MSFLDDGEVQQAGGLWRGAPAGAPLCGCGRHRYRKALSASDQIPSNSITTFLLRDWARMSGAGGVEETSRGFQPEGRSNAYIDKTRGASGLASQAVSEDVFDDL